MTDLRRALADIHWSMAEFAEACGVAPTTVRRWSAGTAEMPERMAAWIEAASAWHRAHPVPRKHDMEGE
jgi:transcriptional regulator with XRE-family HTH domain